jgi:hypothetical protein
MGAGAVTADSNYVYMVMSQGCNGSASNNSYGNQGYPACGTTWYAVRRYDHSGNPAQFGSSGYDGSMLIVNTSANLAGIAAGGGQLFVADPSSNQIKIYTASNMSAAGSFGVTNPGPLAYDSVSGTIWMIQSGTSNIVHYSTSGSLLPQNISVASPTALAVGSNGDLLVADNGPDQNVKIYSNIESSPTLSSSLGSVGGQYASGQIAPLSFGGLTGVGTDSSGNIYVTMNGLRPNVDTSEMISTSIRSFTSSGSLNWQLYCNSFVDTGVIDPTTDGADVYTKNIHYKLDLSQAIGSQVTPVGVSQNPLKYADDMRTQLGEGFAYPVGIRYINGQKFMFALSMYQNGLMIYRFNGETAIPSGWLGQSNNGAAYPPNHPSGNWIWRDVNGDGDFQAGEFWTAASGVCHLTWIPTATSGLLREARLKNSRCKVWIRRVTRFTRRPPRRATPFLAASRTSRVCSMFLEPTRCISPEISAAPRATLVATPSAAR